MSGCYDCGRPYGENGFEDLVIPSSVWRQISPSGNGGGLLCACCICARLTISGIRCEGAFMSGPIETVGPRLMEALMRCENLEERLGRLASGIETEGHDHEDGHGAEHESPVDSKAGETPQ